MDRETKTWWKISIILLTLGFLNTIGIRWYLINILSKEEMKIQKAVNEILPITDFFFYVFIVLGIITISVLTFVWFGEKIKGKQLNS